MSGAVSSSHKPIIFYFFKDLKNNNLNGEFLFLLIFDLITKTKNLKKILLKFRKYGDLSKKKKKTKYFLHFRTRFSENGFVNNDAIICILSVV